jgi:hypothetical protein
VMAKAHIALLTLARWAKHAVPLFT